MALDDGIRTTSGLNKVQVRSITFEEKCIGIIGLGSYH